MQLVAVPEAVTVEVDDLVHRGNHTPLEHTLLEIREAIAIGVDPRVGTAPVVPGVERIVVTRDLHGVGVAVVIGVGIAWIERPDAPRAAAAATQSA